MASAIGSCTSHRRGAHASAAPPPAAPPSNAHLRSPTLSRAQPLVTRPPAAHPPTGTGAGGVGRRRTRSEYGWQGEGRAMGGSAVCGGARRRAGVGAVLGAARAARGLCAEAPAAVRWMGHASRGRRAVPGQTGDGAATHFTASTKSKFESGTAKRISRTSRSASRGGSPPPDWLPPNGLGAAAPAHHASGAPRGAVGEPSLASGKKDSALHSFTSSSSCERSAVARDYVTSCAVHRRYFTFALSWCTAPLNGATVPNRGFSRFN